ncbi:MAG: prepilin-type N-terminal cleavage/methylation domain-containing protein [Bacillota bacterium]|nr:prepilin-type N-terminal cleavage/methylation domain-containing protein [Bacillota bacterium]
MTQTMKKLWARGGMSLSELLVAILILSLVSLGVAVGVSSAMRVYQQSVELSDAQTLSSTLATAIMDELRFARDVSGTDNPSFTSATFGEGVSLDVDDNGYVTVGGQRLVGTGAYAGYLQAEKPDITYQNGIFQVILTINGKSDDQVREVEFSVVPINNP